MSWLGVTAVGFLLVLGLVIWLARTSTARWERDRRAARAPRPDAAAGPPPPVGPAARLRDALVRTAGAVPRLTRPAPGLLRHVVGVLTPPGRLLPHVPPLRRVLRPLRIRRRQRTPAEARDLPVDEREDGREDPVPQHAGVPRWTRSGRDALRRRRPFWFPHHVRSDARSGDPEGAAPGAPAEDRPRRG